MLFKISVPILFTIKVYVTTSPASPIVPFEFVSATEAVLYNCIAGPLVCVTVTVAVQVSVFPH